MLLLIIEIMFHFLLRIAFINNIVSNSCLAVIFFH
ncbi:Uncharacterised protein [Shimwellia blattae]|nr:Uncharacterised protein [Shimwellia blattae]VEC21973.1 Uncharacterised protein [Shimwellia blattae]